VQRTASTIPVNGGSTVPAHGAADHVRHGGGSAAGCSGCCLQRVGGGQSESRSRSIRVTVNPRHDQSEPRSVRVTVSPSPEPHPLAARAASVRVRVSPGEPVGDRNRQGRHAVRSRRRCRPVATGGSCCHHSASHRTGSCRSPISVPMPSGPGRLTSQSPSTRAGQAWGLCYPPG
jgi:hypothetical protein